jgi:hypothetical protein
VEVVDTTAGVGAGDQQDIAVTVDVIEAVLAVVLHDEHRRAGPLGGVAQVVDQASDGQVVGGHLGLRCGLADHTMPIAGITPKASMGRQALK